MYSATFRMLRPRHPLARLAVALLGVVVVVALLALSLFAVAALAIGGGLFLLVGAVRRLLKPAAVPRAAPRAAAATPGVIEGEYTVVETTSTRSPGR